MVQKADDTGVLRRLKRKRHPDAAETAIDAGRSRQTWECEDRKAVPTDLTGK